MQITQGVAYVCASSVPGVVGFEVPLHTEVIFERERRTTRVQSYAVPAFAVVTPGAVRKITGIT